MKSSSAQRWRASLHRLLQLNSSRTTVVAPVRRPRSSGSSGRSAHSPSPRRFIRSRLRAVRGQAYLATRQYAQAAAEFEKILAHRGVVLSDPVDAFARPGLARARAAAGDVARAREAYQDVLTLWTDATQTSR